MNYITERKKITRLEEFHGGFFIRRRKTLSSLNAFDSCPPKQDWLRRFFDEPREFLTHHGLDSRQFYSFCIFLRGAQLLEKKSVTSFAYLLKNFGWDRESALALMLVNLVVSNVQIRWFVENFPLEKTLMRSEVEVKLLSTGLSKSSARKVMRSFKQLSGTAFGTILKFGKVTYIGNQLITLTRTKTKITDGRVILYSLYKMAERCGERQFTLTSLLEITESPAKIFGLTSDELEQFLNGLSANFPEFIDATFTHDLEKISLVPDKDSKDVLKLFED